MNPEKWGPHTWIIFHTIAYNYPEKNPGKNKRKHAKEFYENLKYSLPCKFCRQSYNKFIKELPVENFLDSREQLTTWAYLIHNKVNQKLRNQNKKGNIKKDPTKESIDQKYEKFRSK